HRRTHHQRQRRLVHGELRQVARRRTQRRRVRAGAGRTERIPGMSEIPQRQAYGMALAEYGDLNHDVVVLDADVSSSTLTKYFADRHPDRFFNLGVTEASMVDIGAGLALGGAIPFVNTFAALLTLRACEQIRTC